MKPIEQLVKIVGPQSRAISDPVDWPIVEKSLGIKLPKTYKELIDAFGHGVWGRDLVFLHPFGSRNQGLTRDNLIQRREFCDDNFRDFMPGEKLSEWRMLLVGVLPYRCAIYFDLADDEVIDYDGDMSAANRTGMGDLAEFILQSLSPHPKTLPGFEFAEANWPPEMPVFLRSFRKDPDGFYAAHGIEADLDN